MAKEVYEKTKPERFRHLFMILTEHLGIIQHNLSMQEKRTVHTNYVWDLKGLGWDDYWKGVVGKHVIPFCDKRALWKTNWRLSFCTTQVKVIEPALKEVQRVYPRDVSAMLV